MKPTNPPSHSIRRSILLGSLFVLGCVLLVTLVVILRPGTTSSPATQTTSASPSATTVTHSGQRLRSSSASASSFDVPARPAEEIVAEKLGQFADSREAIVADMAQRFNVSVPSDVARFFAAARAGNWQETTNLFAALLQLRRSENPTPGLEKLWPAIVETYSVAEQIHLWPAQQLLDYGNAVLDSLRPGMIYVGGNDAGHYIPTMLTETSGGEPHIVLSQNALADGSYLEYVRFRYGNKLNTLSGDDSQKGFQDYLTDAQKRVQHDLAFPNEPKQVRPGEDIRVTDGRVQVSGQVAVMAINERLLQTLLQKNPDLSFALTESFPLKSFYGEATTLGAVTELRATDSANALTPERAAQSIDWWRSTTQPLLADTDPASTSRNAYAKLILGQAGLFQDRQMTGAAEQAYQLATTLSPGNAEGVTGYVNLLTQQQRYGEARQVVQAAMNTAPANQTFRDLWSSLSQLK